MKTDSTYLKHILKSISDIEEFTTGLTASRFLDDRKTIYAVIRSIEIIGEASNKLSIKFKDTNTEIPWKDIISMRNRLIHDYFGVDNELVWDTVKNYIPKLKVQIEDLLNNLE